MLRHGAGCDVHDKRQASDSRLRQGRLNEPAQVLRPSGGCGRGAPDSPAACVKGTGGVAGTFRRARPGEGRTLRPVRRSLNHAGHGHRHGLLRRQGPPLLRLPHPRSAGRQEKRRRREAMLPAAQASWPRLRIPHRRPRRRRRMAHDQGTSHLAPHHSRHGLASKFNLSKMSSSFGLEKKNIIQPCEHRFLLTNERTIKGTPPLPHMPSSSRYYQVRSCESYPRSKCS
mmetsp:Transcript_29488/g.95071  ORF Transcript_29488/g.95071 Transcript_29488/m.95071 type:complete len:228 (-) Transcript_29488:80-763(-)